MNRKNLLFAFLVAAAAGVIVLCNIQTASGPTPYSVFNDQTTSSSSVAVGMGPKTFIIPASLPIVAGDRTVTITAATNDSIFMDGIITSYDVKTGSLTVNVTTIKGSGTINNWKVVLGKTFDEVQDSLRQAYTNMQFGMFLHFNMSTFDRCCCSGCYSVTGEWGLPNTPEIEFRPNNLSCGQWADVAKSAGCKYVVLVSKHHDGFCLWPSQWTNHCVKNAACTTDVIRRFVDSVRSRGLRPGLYYSIRDLTNGIDTNFIKHQLTELLSNYGDLVCLWFDGWGWDAGYNRVPFTMVRNLIKSIQPYCLLIENNHEYTTKHSEIVEYEMPIDGPPKLNNVLPAEGNEPIRQDVGHCWFWHPIDSCTIMSASYIVSRLNLCNSRNASYLLDLTPDTTGVIPGCQVEVMKEVGQIRNVVQ
ncbi:MAG: alpha-L-fucosidase [Chitinispirillaceae bacterium]